MKYLHADYKFSTYKRKLSEDIKIETSLLKRNQSDYSLIKDYQIVFILKGRVKFTLDNVITYDGVEGKMIFLPAEMMCSYEVLSDTEILTIHIHSPLLFANKFTREAAIIPQLVEIENRVRKDLQNSPPMIVPELYRFLNGLKFYLDKGVSSPKLLKIKAEEFLLLAKTFYSTEELSNFFYPLLSKDTTFSEYIRLNWHRFETITELASAMELSTKKFTTKFIQLFGENPQRWIINNKAQVIYREIVSTDKPFSQIADENNFNNDSHFSRFCKKELHHSPTQLRKNHKTNL